MKRQALSVLALTATLAASMLPVHANPIAPSSRSSGDSRSMCNDVGLGHNMQKDIEIKNDMLKTTQNDIGGSSEFWDSTSSRTGYKQTSASGGGGVSFLGFGASGSGSSSKASGYNNYDNYKGSYSSYFDKSSTYAHDRSTTTDKSSATLVVGQDCTEVVRSQTAITQQLLGW